MKSTAMRLAMLLFIFLSPVSKAETIVGIITAIDAENGKIQLDRAEYVLDKAQGNRFARQFQAGQTVRAEIDGNRILNLQRFTGEIDQPMTNRPPVVIPRQIRR